MNEDFFSKTTNKRPLSGAQKAALLLYLMRTDNTEQVMARLSTDEIRRINDNLSVLSSRIDIYDDIAVLEEFQRFCVASSLMSKDDMVLRPDDYVVKGAAQLLKKQSMEMDSKEVARVIGTWLQDE